MLPCCDLGFFYFCHWNCVILTSQSKVVLKILCLFFILNTSKLFALLAKVAKWAEFMSHQVYDQHVHISLQTHTDIHLGFATNKWIHMKRNFNCLMLTFETTSNEKEKINFQIRFIIKRWSDSQIVTVLYWYFRSQKEFSSTEL